MPGSGISTAIAGRTHLGGLGSKPWLQKVAVFLVACGLTVASVDTFRVAGFMDGYEIINASDIRDRVSGSLEVRIVRVISGVFVWLAQVQTLMRLFPRRKEKLIIKWFGFSLILCDLIFNCLNNFLGSAPPEGSPTHYQDAIPALSYLFQLAISLLYMAWVSYYVATKKQYAFFIPDQLNMLVIAILAMISVAIPVAFFVADISVPKVAGWGDFLRWVGSAAASILVWEWVDRIEAVEREAKRDGILGREVFDEDELPTSENRGSYDMSRRGSATDGGRSNARSTTRSFSSQFRLGEIVQGFSRKRRRRRRSMGAGDEKVTLPVKAEQTTSSSGTSGSDADNTVDKDQTVNHQGRGIIPPPRVDTASADSTIYAVVYHPVTATPPAVPMQTAEGLARRGSQILHEREVTFASEPIRSMPSKPEPAKTIHTKPASAVPGWNFAVNAFKRSKSSPPIEVKNALSLDTSDAGAREEPVQNKRKLHERLTTFRPVLGDKGRPDGISPPDASALPPMVIPAPPRGQTWSPDILRHSPVNALQNVGSTSRLHVNPALLQHRTPVSTNHRATNHARNPARVDGPSASTLAITSVPAQNHTVTTEGRPDEESGRSPTETDGRSNNG